MTTIDEYEAERVTWCIEHLEQTAGSIDKLATVFRAALKDAGNQVYLDKLIPELQRRLPGLSYWHSRELLLCKTEAAHFAGCSLPALNDAIRRGKLRTYNVDGGPHLLIFDCLDYALQGTAIEELAPEKKAPVKAAKGHPVKVKEIDQDGNETTTIKTL